MDIRLANLEWLQVRFFSMEEAVKLSIYRARPDCMVCISDRIDLVDFKYVKDSECVY